MGEAVKHDIHIMSDKEELYQTAANDFFERSVATVNKKGMFSVVLSGGETPKGLFEKLAEKTEKHGKSSIPWEHIHFFWGDERYVSKTDPSNNYRLAEEYLFSKVPVNPEHIHAIPTDAGSARNAAAGYETRLKSIFMLESDELPKFDLVYLGLGADGHTASLFPGSALVQRYSISQYRMHLVEHYTFEDLLSARITLTPPVFNNAAQVIFLVVGESKAKAFDVAVNGEYAPEKCPAHLIKPTDGKIIWLVDRGVVAN